MRTSAQHTLFVSMDEQDGLAIARRQTWRGRFAALRFLRSLIPPLTWVTGIVALFGLLRIVSEPLKELTLPVLGLWVCGGPLFAWAAVTRSRIDIVPEGLHIEWLFMRALVPWHAIRGAVPFALGRELGDCPAPWRDTRLPSSALLPRGLRLELVDGDIVRVTTGIGLFDRTDIAAIAVRVEGALTAYRRQRSLPQTASEPPSSAQRG